MPESLSRRLATNTVANWTQYAVAVASAVLLTPLVVHRLGAAPYGVWMLLSQLTGYAGLLDLGIQPALVRYIARARAQSDRQQINLLVSTALSLGTVVGCVVIAAALLLSFHVDVWFDVGGVPLAEVRGAAILIGAAAATAIPASLLGAVLKAHQRFDRAALVGVASQITRALGTLAVVSGGGGVRGLAVVSLLANTVGITACLWQVRREDPGLRIRRRSASPKAATLLLSFGAYSLLGSAGSYLAYGTDALVIGAILSASDVAFFGLAANVLLVLSGLVAGFTGTLMPLASEAEARNDTSQTARHYLVATRVALLIAMPGLLVAIAAGPALMTAWLGAPFGEPSGHLLRILAFAHIALVANSAALPIALGMGLHRPASVLLAVEGVLNLGLSIVLARPLGVGGVALGTALPSLLVQGMVWPVIMCRAFGIRPSRYVREALAPHLGCIAAAACAAALAHVIWRPASTFGSIITASLIPPVYWAVSAFTCFSADIRARWATRLAAVSRGRTSR